MAFLTKKHLSRRTFLNGMGVTIALPFLESMVPAATPVLMVPPSCLMVILPPAPAVNPA